MPSGARIRPQGDCVASTMLFRYRGQHTLTPIVKATFAFAEGVGRMKTIAPARLRDVDRLPGRAQADVIVHAGGRRLRFGLHRDAMLVDLHLASEPAVGAGLPEKLREAIALDLPLVILPDDFDWSTLQLAPANQRVGFLRGDEWVLLESEGAVGRMQLPSAVARCQIRAIDGVTVDTPVPLQADTLIVDLAAATCSVVWRGSLPLPRGTAPSAELVAWVQTADAPAPPAEGDTPETLVMADKLSRIKNTMPFSLTQSAGPRRDVGPIAGAPWSPVTTQRSVALDPNRPLTLDADEPAPRAVVIPPNFPPEAPAFSLDETRPDPPLPDPPPPASAPAPPPPPPPRVFEADRRASTAPDRAPPPAPPPIAPRPLPAFGASLKKDLYAFGSRKR